MSCTVGCSDTLRSTARQGRCQQWASCCPGAVQWAIGARNAHVVGACAYGCTGPGRARAGRVARAAWDTLVEPIALVVRDVKVNIELDVDVAVDVVDVDRVVIVSTDVRVLIEVEVGVNVDVDAARSAVNGAQVGPGWHKRRYRRLQAHAPGIARTNYGTADSARSRPKLS
eukprot:163385-Amphidinium_carterae.1